jgi:hypothetical protein
VSPVRVGGWNKPARKESVYGFRIAPEDPGSKPAWDGGSGVWSRWGRFQGGVAMEWLILLSIFFGGVAVGYGPRSFISARRHARARAQSIY